MQEKTVDATGRTPVTGALVHFDEGGKHCFVDNDGYDVWRLAAGVLARQESEQDQCSICLDDFDDAVVVGLEKVVVVVVVVVSIPVGKRRSRLSRFEALL